MLTAGVSETSAPSSRSSIRILPWSRAHFFRTLRTCSLVSSHLGSWTQCSRRWPPQSLIVLFHRMRRSARHDGASPSFQRWSRPGSAGICDLSLSSRCRRHGAQQCSLSLIFSASSGRSNRCETVKRKVAEVHRISCSCEGSRQKIKVVPCLLKSEARPSPLLIAAGPCLSEA